MSPEIRSFPPHDPSIITMGRKPNPDKLHELAETTKRDGQLLPGLAAPVPPEWHALSPEKRNAVLRSYMIVPRDFTPQTQFVSIDGNQRMIARWVNDLDYSARLLDVLPPPLEAVRMGWHANESRQKMSVYERAEYLEAVKRAMPGASIEEVAKALNGSKASTIRNELQPRRIPEDWRPRTVNLHQQVIRIIGAIPKLQDMDAAITFACGDGTPATQIAVLQFLKEQKRTVGRKPGKLKLTIDGMEIVLTVKTTHTAADVAQRFETLVKKAAKLGNTPAYACGPLLA